MVNQYIEFVKKHHKAVKAKYPSAKPQEVMKKIAELYRSSKKQKGKGIFSDAIDGLTHPLSMARTLIKTVAGNGKKRRQKGGYFGKYEPTTTYISDGDYIGDHRNRRLGIVGEGKRKQKGGFLPGAPVSLNGVALKRMLHLQ